MDTGIEMKMQTFRRLLTNIEELVKETEELDMSLPYDGKFSLIIDNVPDFFTYARELGVRAAVRETDQGNTEFSFQYNGCVFYSYLWSWEKEMPDKMTGGVQDGNAPG